MKLTNFYYAQLTLGICACSAGTNAQVRPDVTVLKECKSLNKQAIRWPKEMQKTSCFERWDFLKIFVRTKHRLKLNYNHL